MLCWHSQHTQSPTQQQQVLDTNLHNWYRLVITLIKYIAAGTWLEHATLLPAYIVSLIQLSHNNLGAPMYCRNELPH